MRTRRRRRGGSPTGCAVPSASFRILPNGQMDACCINEAVWLGKYPEVSLHEAWTHPELRALRKALARGDFSHGCEACGAAFAAGNRNLTHAHSYDDFLDTRRSAYPRVLEFSLSNRCNLACVMCSGDVSSRIRHEREHLPPLVSPYDDAFFDELADFLPHLDRAFFAGGEPFLSRLNDRVWQMMVDLDCVPYVGVTTNGTVVNERVEHWLRALRMDISLSIDGFTAATNEAIRLGVDHRELLLNRRRLAEIAASYGGVLKVNFALQRGNWTELADALVETEDHGFEVWLSMVRAPEEVSLLTLSAEELATIDRVWSEQEPQVASLVANRHAWDQARAEVTRAITQMQAVPVSLPAPRLRGTPPSD